MPDNVFLDALRRSATPPDQAAGVLATLDQCDGVRQYTGGALECRRFPGFVTNLGQECRIVLRSPGSVEHILFRAHVPASGFPVRLDLYEEDLVECRDQDTLRERLKEFLEHPTTRDAINSLSR